jgi:RNA polymerase sigma-70 factor (ECF subfamily)
VNAALTDEIAEQHVRFNALVLPHLDRLLGFARRRTDDATDAEDAVQEACVRAWTAFGSLKDATVVRAWLYRILRSVLSDDRDRNERRQQLVPVTRLEDAFEEMVSTEHDFVFAEVAARIESEALHSALKSIPDELSRAVELHDIDGFKYHEIADIEEIPIGTVMSRISRGRRMLAAVIMKERGRSSATTDAENIRPLRSRRGSK